MTNIRKPSIGSISEGTMRTADLLEALGWELQHISEDPKHQALALEARERAHYFTWNDLPEGEEVEETENDSLIVTELFDALEELAPPYCYFGANEGDGASYGFWPNVDAIDELPRITMTEGEEIPAEDHVYVNDHGNVTLFDSAGNEIWSIV